MILHESQQVLLRFEINQMAVGFVVPSDRLDAIDIEVD